MLVAVAGKILPGAWDPPGPPVLEMTLYFSGRQVVSSRGPSLQDPTLTQECERRHQGKCEIRSVCPTICDPVDLKRHPGHPSRGHLHGQLQMA